MKNRNVLLTVAVYLGMISGLTAQNVPSYVPTNGLVGWWPFNGNANDESGNGNNGMVNGPTLTSDRFGNAGKAYEFSNDFITIPHQSSLNPFPLSVFAWCKGSPGNVTNAIVSKYTSNSANGWAIHSAGGKLSAYYFNFPGGSEMNFDMFQSETPVVIDNVWHLVGLICDNQSARLYVDGVLRLEKNYLGSGLPGAPSTTSSLYIGKDFEAGGLDGFFNGKIDDIAIYNRALNQQEITALYQGGNSTANCMDLPTNLQQGLVGYWPFCGNVNDESGNGRNGIINGGVTLSTDRFGQNNSAYSFNGIDGFIEVPNSTEMNYSDGYSLSGWIKFTQNQTDNNVFSKHSTGIQNGFILGVLENKARFYSNSTNLLSSEPINSGTWHHLLATFNGVTMKLYLDNIIQDTINQPYLLNNFSINIGKALGCCFFNGYIDDIAIWNRALNQSEITQLYNQGICKTSITVTDTLLIHTGITSYNPVAYQNTLKVWPNPGNQDITIDAGNLALMQGWKIRVSNAQGVQIYPSGSQSGLINQQQQTLDMSGWGGNGLYFLYLIDPQNNIQEVKKIVLAP